jgi:hypothetical protein
MGKSQAASVLPSKTNPKSSRTRSKGKEKAAPKKKQKTAAPSVHFLLLLVSGRYSLNTGSNSA